MADGFERIEFLHPLALRASGLGRSLAARPRTSERIDPAFYDGALPSAFVKLLARLRTDLDRFQTEEAALLSYHSYWSLHTRLMTFYPDP